MSDQVTISLIGSIITLVGVVFTGIMAYLMAKLKQGQETAAVKVGEVAVKLDANTAATDGKLDGLARVAHDTHVLVNNNMAIQLRLNAGNARFKADTTKRKEDVDAANEADRLLSEHEARQFTVDFGISK